MFRGSVVSTVHSIDGANSNLCSFGKHVRKSKRAKKYLNLLKQGATQQPKAIETEDHRTDIFRL